MALLGIEHEQRADLGVGGLTAGLDPDAAFDHGDECLLLDFVLAERLTRSEPDQDRARLSGVEHDRRAAPLRRVDLEQVPTPHGAAASYCLTCRGRSDTISGLFPHGHGTRSSVRSQQGVT